MAENCSTSECGSLEKCQGCPSNAKGGLLKPAHRLNKIRHVIGVVSGKGGVGKSSVTSMLALEARQRGYKVGILDADITGPSIPKAFGVVTQAYGIQEGIVPAESSTGIKIMSINLLLEDPEQPVLWRGPVLGNMVSQFWTDVIWGELDYLFVDMPPGTGDVPLTVFQSLPVDGIVIVTSPQELVSMIVEKAVKMANMMDVPIIGLVENMSYFRCPDNGKEYKIFGESHIDTIADQYNIPVLTKLGIDPKIAENCDKGCIDLCDTSAFNDIFKYI